MINNSRTFFLTALLVPGMAFANVNVGDSVGISETSIQSALEAQGYAVMAFEVEADEIEVQASKDGQIFEIEVAADTGLVLEVELEDENDDDQDDDDDPEQDA